MNGVSFGNLDPPQFAKGVNLFYLLLHFVRFSKDESMIFWLCDKPTRKMIPTFWAFLSFDNYDHFKNDIKVLSRKLYAP